MKKSAQRDADTAMRVVSRSQKFSPVAHPLPGGAVRPKFNQLEMVIGHLHVRTQFSEDRCMQFQVIVVTDPQSHKHTTPARVPIADRTDNNTLHC